MTMAGLRFVSAEVGVQFVMTSGRIRMLALHVDSLVSLSMVRNSYSIIVAVSRFHACTIDQNFIIIMCSALGNLIIVPLSSIVGPYHIFLGFSGSLFS